MPRRAPSANNDLLSNAATPHENDHRQQQRDPLLLQPQQPQPQPQPSQVVPPLPNMPLCSITGQAMVDPVVAADGHTYERSAIARWLLTSDKSPLTGSVLDHKNLVPNYSLLTSLEDAAAAAAAASAQAVPMTSSFPPRVAAAVLPTQYDWKTGEEHETCLLELRCRTRKWASAANMSNSNNSSSNVVESEPEQQGTQAEAAVAPVDHWQDVGTGLLRVLRHFDGEGQGHVRLVQRQQSKPDEPICTKVILNVPVWHESAIIEVEQEASSNKNAASEKYVKLVTMSESTAMTLLFKFKDAWEASVFKDLLQEQRLVAQSMPVAAQEQQQAAVVAGGEGIDDVSALSARNKCFETGLTMTGHSSQTTTTPARKVLSQNPEAIRSRQRRAAARKDDRLPKETEEEKEKKRELREYNRLAQQRCREKKRAATNDDDRNTGVVSPPNHNMFHGSFTQPRPQWQPRLTNDTQEAPFSAPPYVQSNNNNFGLNDEDEYRPRTPFASARPHQQDYSLYTPRSNPRPTTPSFQAYLEQEQAADRDDVRLMDQQTQIVREQTQAFREWSAHRAARRSARRYDAGFGHEARSLEDAGFGDDGLPGMALPSSHEQQYNRRSASDVNDDSKPSYRSPR
jgi:U-box domain